MFNFKSTTSPVDRSGLALLAALTVAVATSPMACRPEPSDGRDPKVVAAIGRLLASVGPEVVSPALDRADASAAALRAACDAWAVDPASPAAHTGARDAWRAAMAEWQFVEALQLGPAAPSASSVGGADLRDDVYSWPTVNPCRVDQETVGDGWTDPDAFLADSLVNVRGLDALEVLLFAGAENHCPAEVSPNADGAWALLGEDGVTARRAAYARVLAGGVADGVSALREAWDPEGGDFSGALAAAGDGRPYARQDDGLDAVFQALFYLESQVQDGKLGPPLDRVDCGGPCSDAVETPLAGGSNRWIAANLRGLEALYTGGDGAGLDDVLRSAGEGALADRLTEAVAAASTAAQTLEVDVDVAAAGDRTAADALFDAVTDVTDLLGGEVATALMLTVPTEVAGDND